MSVYEMPLFPLNTVLFPGMPLHLHIFEGRYKTMIKLCVDQSTSFGVVLIDRGSEAFGPLAETHDVGCSARIIEVQTLADERMNIVAIGQERFRTISLDRNKAPYLNGVVQPFPLVDTDNVAVRKAGDRLKPWLQKYLDILATAAGVDFDVPQIPDDPVALAYLAAIALQVSNNEKQGFLSTETTLQLMDHLQAVYQREVAILRAVNKSSDIRKNDRISLN